MSTLARKLKAINACKEAVEWAKDYQSFTKAWKKCKRADWMLWLCGKFAGRTNWPTQKDIVLAACDCAELVQPIYEKKYPKSSQVRDCINTTRKWVRGEATIMEVRQARNAANAAAYDAYDAANAAANAAAYAAYAAASAAASAAAYAAYDAAAYDAAAYDAAAYAANAAAAYDAAAYATNAAATIQNKCANICRKRLKVPKWEGKI